MNTDSANVVVVEREMPAAPEKVWRALTEGPLLKEWLMDNDFQPAVGRQCQFRTKPVAHWNGIIDSEVLSAEPPRRLSYTWNSMGVTSVVAWTLTPTKTGTLLRMEQSGFGPDQKANYEGAKYGWQKFIGNLETVLRHLP